MVEENKLELSFPGFGDFGRMGNNLHSFFSRSETGREKLGLTLLLNYTEPAGPKGDEPPVVTQGWDPDAGRLGSLENGPALFNLYFDTVNRQLDGLIFGHNNFAIRRKS